MTHDEAARPDANGEQAPPAASPSDERPRPRYGEYAPPGWSWQPPGEPGDADASAATPPAHAAPAPVAADVPSQADAADAAPTARRTAPAWDRPVTIGLLVLGALGAVNTAMSMQQIPQQVQLSYDMLGVGEFTAPAWLSAASFVSTVVQLALYAAVLGLTILRLRANRLAFWIPLVGGAVSFVLLMILLGAVMLGDPAYLEWMRSSATPAPTP